MSALKYAMGMLAVGATAMGAGASHAGTIFVDNTVYTGFTDGTPFSHDIFLGGSSTAQFNYNGGQAIIGVKNFLDAHDTARLNPSSFTGTDSGASMRTAASAK